MLTRRVILLIALIAIRRADLAISIFANALETWTDSMTANDHSCVPFSGNVIEAILRDAPNRHGQGQSFLSFVDEGVTEV
jgi:hypothetical protein